MKTRPLEDTDIAIVARSCVLPGARNPEEFWSLCFNEKSMIKEISPVRMTRPFGHYSKWSTGLIQSVLACEISIEDYEHYLSRHHLSRENSNRLFTYTVEAVDQIFNQMKPQADQLRKDLILGCMNPDSDYEMQILRENRDVYSQELSKAVGRGDSRREKFLNEVIDSTIDVVTEHMCQPTDNFFTSQTVARVAERFGINGENYLIDAACASSISALQMALNRLKLYKSDLIIAGGIESNLGYGSYMAFSSVGALAEKTSMPFDKKSQGIVQGEGVVLFALKRLSDAVRDDDHIHGIIRAVSGGSDGRSASLFQPNAAGQSLVYEKVYGSDRDLSYLEAHGTGTEVGDQTEMESITTFFKGRRFPVGSVKALVGHGKGAAGATGVMKSLFIIKDKIIPGSSYVTHSRFTTENAPYINLTAEKIEESKPTRVGINAFGFGGTNYHLLLEEYVPGCEITNAPAVAEQPIVIIAESKIDLKDFTSADFSNHEFPFRLPPKALASIDKVQLASLVVAWNCIRFVGKPWQFIAKEKINVVSACTLFLDQIIGSVHRVAYEMVECVIDEKEEAKPLREDMQNFIKNDVHTRFIPMNEDSATGVLNNVIAGRVCNVFDLFGKSFNVDKDIVSGPVTLQAVENELRINPDQIFLCLLVDESLDKGGRRSCRNSITARLITTASFAIENELKAQSTIVTDSCKVAP